VRNDARPAENTALMTIREAADRCHVDYNTFLRWVAKGVLPHVVVGPFRSKRVYRRDVEQLIQPGA
jgi:excisionase family DNA binding protein